MIIRPYGLVQDLPRRHRDRRGDLRFIDRHDLDFITPYPRCLCGEQSRQTKPICRGRAGMGDGRQRSSIPAPLGQSLRNKANSAGAERRASALWKQSYGELDTQMASAKQSQFPPAQQWPGAGTAARAAGGTACINKANLPTGTEMGAGRGSHQRRRSGSLRQTNPICRLPTGRCAGGQGCKCCCRRGGLCETKPISRTGKAREGAAAGASVRNKANLHQATGRTSAL
jgi:hypothetical protein